MFFVRNVNKSSFLKKIRFFFGSPHVQYKKCDPEMHHSSSVAAIELIFGAITVLLTVSVILSSSSPPPRPCVHVCKQVIKCPQSVTLVVHSHSYCHWKFTVGVSGHGVHSNIG